MNVCFLFSPIFELINFLVKFISDIRTKEMKEVVISVRRAMGIIWNFTNMDFQCIMSTLCLKCCVCQTDFIKF